MTVVRRFHAAQEGEPGFGTPENDPLPQQSSLAQLSSSSTSDHLTPYADTVLPPMDDQEAFLSPAEIEELRPFLNPIYLKSNTIKALVSKFSAESSIELHEFLREDLATSLKSHLLAADDLDSLGPRRLKKIPSHSSGAEVPGWGVKGPPHKHRYCSLSNPPPPTPVAEWTTILQRLQTSLFPSPGFRAWLRHVTTLIPLSYAAEARRFRPGLDYTLAKATESEARLDVILGLTAPASQLVAEEAQDWEDANWGGWEVCSSCANLLILVAPFLTPAC